MKTSNNSPAFQVTSVYGPADTEAGVAHVDMHRLRTYRLKRVRDELDRQSCGAAILMDPVNIRYTTGYRQYEIFQMHLPSNYLFVPVDGPVVLFGRSNYGLETIDEVQLELPTNYYSGGPRLAEQAVKTARHLEDLVRRYGGKENAVAVDRLNLDLTRALEAEGVQLVEAGGIMELARYLKSPDEILCMNHSIAVAEAGIFRMVSALAPGVTEVELWAILHQTNIAAGGEWVETRLLSSGERSNPWGQEASTRVIRSGDLVAFDTDMIGPLGYCADISRTIHCGPGRPSKEQKELYTVAYEEVGHNIGLIRAGVGFRDFANQAFRVPKRYSENRYSCLVHGVGMVDEYPKIYQPSDWSSRGYDGVFEENTTVCVESYVGATNGREGVKLEEQVLVTSEGCRLLSRYPFEEMFLE